MALITHITPVLDSRGGMQNHLRRQVELERAAGHDSRVVKIFEPTDAAAIGLDAKWWWNPGRLRKVFQRQARAATNGALVVYHNAWGLPLLAPGDGATRRVAYLHTDWPELETAVKAAARWSDGMVCVSEELVGRVQRQVPDYPRDRVARISYPVSPPLNLSVAARAGGAQPLRVGYVGRLQSEQKRVERLPELMCATARLGVAVEWQVLGDGPERARLAQEAGGAKFHGWLAGEEYWRTLAALDVVVFFSDYEGTPIALLEAMSVGVTPLFPAIGGDGEQLARALDPAGVYPAGDVAAASRQLATLAGDREGRRARARQAVAARTVENYAAELARVLRDAQERPRYSSTETNRPGRLTDLLPMALVRRYWEKAIWC